MKNSQTTSQKQRHYSLMGCLTLAVSMTVGTLPTVGQTIEEVAKRLDRLERENAELKRAISGTGGVGDGYTSPNDYWSQTGFVGFNSPLSYKMLDPTTAGKSKPLTLLESKRDGTSGPGLIIGGALTALADYQTTKYRAEVGYLMRHPENQFGKSASEFILHSAQLGVTANITPWLSGFAELLWDPSQSFGSGTITSLARNEVQVRKGYLLIGDLKQTPFYGMIGKIESPFGQTDTVSPFSLSTSWHTFSGLSYGALVGYSKDGLNIAAEAVQGGAEFRGLNTPVDTTNVPSKVNNFVVDANYRVQLDGARRSVMFGASYEHGSPYCLEFPIAHFSTCKTNNPAYGFYGEVKFDDLKFKGAFNQTTKVWPGTFNPNAPLNVFPASKVTSFDIGAQYQTPPVLFGKPVIISAEFSKFIAGPSGAPWESQSQFVTGLAYYPTPTVKLFIEDIAILGYAPLNFLTGGIPGEDPTNLDTNRSARSNVVLAGITAAF